MSNKLKQRVRARMARTGQSYTAALYDERGAQLWENPTTPPHCPLCKSHLPGIDTPAQLADYIRVQCANGHEIRRPL